jgi:hypothetical protein
MWNAAGRGGNPLRRGAWSPRSPGKTSSSVIAMPR